MMIDAGPDPFRVTDKVSDISEYGCAADMSVTCYAWSLVTAVVS